MTRESGTQTAAQPLSPAELDPIDAWWRAANYLSVGQIYLLDNPLLERPLERADIKLRLLGHWGTTPGLNFIYVHLNRVIKARDLDMICVCGPDDERQVLLDTPDNPTEEELQDAIDGLGILERQELLALTWLGRGDYDKDSWPEALRQAGETMTANVTDYLVGTPLLGDYLEEGADTLGLSLGDFKRG